MSIWLVEYHEISSILATSSSNKLRPFKCFIFLCSWLVSLQSPTKRQFWFLEWLMIYCGGVGTNLQLWPDLPNQASGQGQNSDRSRFWCYRPPPMIDARHQRLVLSCLKAINLYLVKQACSKSIVIVDGIFSHLQFFAPDHSVRRGPLPLALPACTGSSIS